MLTFVCDLCGATGAVQAPGSARCTECGYVALVKPPAGWRPTPEPDPFAPSSPERARAARNSVAVNGPPTERRATLWVRPGPEETPTTDPYVIPTPSRPRAASGTVVTLVLLAGSAAVAFAAAAVVGPRWLDDGASSADRAPAPVQQPAPSPAIAVPIEPIPPASVEKIRPVPAKRAVASSSPSPVKGALVNPAPEDRRCVPRALRARPHLAGRLPTEVAVRFRVTASGDVARIEALGLSDRDLANAVSEAVRSCRFSPGTDENGRPIALPITMRIRFAAPPEATKGF